ncbi:MAG: DNA-3-methyladenine glycosylase [Candidatus Thorarchaeota archaeon]
MEILNRNFFERDTLVVAKELLGKKLIFKDKQCIITETEAYIGMNDPACHAAVGKTKRNEVMFGNAGFSYVYLIYGMYHCLNFVTEKKEFPAAVLIRGAKVIDNNSQEIDLNGPGKLCRFLNITKEENNIDIVKSDYFYLTETGLKPKYKITPRVGISKGKDKLWRFVVEN